MLKFCPHCNRKMNVEIDSASGGILCPECGTLLGYSAAALPSGAIVAGFRIENEIGRGGMGVVYRATQLNLSRPIALKVLSDELSSDAAFVETFFHEARSAASLSHPNIVQAYDAGVTRDGLYYFAMEYIDGETLEVKVSRSGPLSPRSAFQLALKISAALGYAWKVRRLCHGDLKPDNILVSSSGDIKLADLGLAKSMYEESVKRDVMVTPLYAAPEIISGKVTSANLASDIYSFGATLYHITVGEPPFKSEKIEDIYRRHLSEAPVPPAERNREIPESLSSIILAMLEKDPAKRPASWEEVSTLFTEAQDAYRLTHTAVDARPPVSRALLATGIVFVLLLLAGGVFTALHFAKTEPEPSAEMITASEPPALIPPREDSAKLDARLRAEWKTLKKRTIPLSPEQQIREYRTFMDRNNLQESLLQEVQGEMARARLEIRRRRRAAAAYAQEIDVFTSLSRFAAFLDRTSVQNLLRLYSGIRERGRLSHLRRIYSARGRELMCSAELLKMRLRCLDRLNGLPYPLKPAEKKSVPERKIPQKTVPGRGTSAPARGASEASARKPVLPVPEKKKTPEQAAEEEFIDIIARQVRNFAPDVLRMQLTGFARKYRSRGKASAEKAEVISKMLLEGDALVAFFYHCNESLKGIPLPEFEKNASYVIVERNSIRIMVVDGKVTIRKRMRLIPSLVSALKLAIYRAYLDESFRRRYSTELQEYVIVNSFFYDNRHAARNIELSTLPEKRKALLRSILADIGKAVKQASASSVF